MKNSLETRLGLFVALVVIATFFIMFIVGGFDNFQSGLRVNAEFKTAQELKLGDRVKIRRNYYHVVGITRRMVSSGGDPMLFIPLKDAQEAQFLKDNDAIQQQRRRTAANPAFSRPGVPGLLDGVLASQNANPYVNAVLVQIKNGFTADQVAEPIRSWKRLQVFTRAQMEEILIGKLIATAAKQIGMFLAILAIVSAATSRTSRARRCRPSSTRWGPAASSLRRRASPARRTRSDFATRRS